MNLLSPSQLMNTINRVCFSFSSCLFEKKKKKWKKEKAIWMHTVQMHALQQVSGCRGGSGRKHDRCYCTASGPLWEQGWHRQASLAIKKTDWIDPTATCVEPKVEKTFVTEQQSLPKENMVWAESDWNSLLEALEWFKDTFVSCSTCCVPSEVAEPICHGEIKFQKRDKTKKQREVGVEQWDKTGRQKWMERRTKW